MSTKILVNLVPAIAGGGLQNALSFVIGLAGQRSISGRVIVICPNGGAVHKICNELKLQVVPVRPGLIGRILFEFGGGAFIAWRHNVKIVFTLFGNAPFVSPKLYRISGFALSNILMPEVDFWQDHTRVQRIIKRTKDYLRLWTVRRSHEIIVETDFLAARARSGAFQDRIVHVVKMEPSVVVTQSLFKLKNERRNDKLRLLALTGPHPNKRLKAMGPIMAHLAALRAAQDAEPPEFLISIDGGHPYAQTVATVFSEAGAPSPRFIGSLAPTEVVEVLSKVDGLVNIARLESFSNNWVEAWAAGILLVSTDADWARASCGAAAIYIDPESPEQAAVKINDAFVSAPAKEALISAGTKQLAELSKKGSKIDAYIEIISRADLTLRETR